MLELMSVLSRVAIGTTGTLMVTIPENDQPVPAGSGCNGDAIAGEYYVAGRVRPDSLRFD